MTATPTPVDTAAIAQRVETIRRRLEAKNLSHGETLEQDIARTRRDYLAKMPGGSRFENGRLVHSEAVLYIAALEQLPSVADIRALLSDNTSLKAEVAALTVRAEAAEAKLAEYVMLEATDLDGNDWTLEADQMLFMMNLNNVIEAANTGDKEAFETLLDLAVSNEYKTLFGEMGLDEAIYRYQSTLEVGRHFNALEATPANGGNDEQ